MGGEAGNGCGERMGLGMPNAWNLRGCWQKSDLSSFVDCTIDHVDPSSV
jgi:hypothetical protein